MLVRLEEFIDESSKEAFFKLSSPEEIEKFFNDKFEQHPDVHLFRLRDKNDHTLLHWVIHSGTFELVKYLTRLTTDPRRRIPSNIDHSSTNKTVHFAGLSHNPNAIAIIAYLCSPSRGNERQTFNVQHSNKDTVLHSAAFYSRIDIMRFVMGNIPPELENDKRFSSSEIAAIKEKLLQEKIPYNAESTNPQWKTPLNVIKYQRTQIISTIFSCASKLNNQNIHHCTVIFLNDVVCRKFYSSPMDAPDLLERLTNDLRISVDQLKSNILENFNKISGTDEQSIKNRDNLKSLLKTIDCLNMNVAQLIGGLECEAMLLDISKTVNNNNSQASQTQPAQQPRASQSRPLQQQVSQSQLLQQQPQTLFHTPSAISSMPNTTDNNAQYRDNDKERESKRLKSGNDKRIKSENYSPHHSPKL